MEEMSPMTKYMSKKVEEKISDGSKLAVVLVANSFRFGGNWAYIKKTDSNYEGKLSLLKEEKGKVEARLLDNGFLILMDKNFLSEQINAVVPNGITQEFREEAKKVTETEVQKYSKFVDNVLEGKSKYLKDMGGYYDLVIGCYSVNETNVIKVNGQERPAYKLPIEIILKELMKKSKEKGKNIIVKVVNEEGQQGAVELANAPKVMKQIFRGLEISDSMTGVFLTIRISK